MKTVLEEFIEAVEIGLEKKFPEVLKDGWRRMAIYEIKQAWEDGSFWGDGTPHADVNEYLEEKYPESFGNVKQKE